MATNKEIVTQVNEAFIQGNVEGFLSHCAEDFTWNMIGDFVTTGKDKVREFMGGMNPQNAPKFTVDKLIGEGDLVACDGEMDMKTREGKDWKGRYCDLYTFKNGKIQEMKSYVVEYKESKEGQ